MKKMVWIVMGLAAGLLMAAVPSVSAQICGLQVADSFETRASGALDLTAGASYGDFQKFFGVRDTFAMTENARVFVDIGGLDAGGSDTDLGLQSGVTVGIPTELPFNLGVRGVVYGENGDAMDIFGSNAMVLGSKEIIFEGLFVYAGLGLDYRGVRKGERSTANWNKELNGIMTVGALMPVTFVSDHLSFYLETTFTDYGFIGLGFRYR